MRTRVDQANGQAVTEYVLLLSLVVTAILAALAVFATPISLALVRLARRTVLNLTS